MSVLVVLSIHIHIMPPETSEYIYVHTYIVGI